jgi:hypothetical protein
MKKKKRKPPKVGPFVGPITGDEHPSGMPFASRPFPLCETEYPKTLNRKLCIHPDLVQLHAFAYVFIYTQKLRFLQKYLSGAHISTDALYWIRPCP